VLDGHTDVVTGVDFVPGTNFAFSSGLDRNLILWDLSTGLPNRILTGHRSLPSTVAVSYDGARAVSGSNSGIGIIWDLAVEDLIQTYGELQSGHIRRVAYASNGAQALAGYTDGHIALWNLQNGTIQHEMTGHAPGAVYDLAFAFNDTVAVSAGSDNLLRLWNLETGEQIGDPLAAHSESIWDIDVSADGTQALSASQDGDVILWDLQTGQILRRYNNLNNGLRILTIEFSPDGRSAIASSNSYLFRFDLLTGAIVQSYRGHSESIVGLAISPDGKLLASSDFRRAVFVRDLETGEILHSFFGHRSAIWGVAFSSDSQLVASASDDGDIVIWDLAQDSISRRFSRSSGVIRSVLFSPDGDYLLFGDTHLRRLRFLDTPAITSWVSENRLVQSLTCAEQGAYSLIALCDEDTTVRTAQIGENRGQIYRDAGLTWMLDARAGQQLDIRVLADQPAGAVVGIERRQILGLLDTVLMVVSPSGIILGTNDDVTDEDSNSQLLDLVLPEDGTYRIEVSSFDGATSGDYTLLIEEVGTRSP
jgi:WD40 repeat protein